MKIDSKTAYSKLAENKAYQHIADYIRSLDRTTDLYKLIILERDYIRKFHYNRLLLNIMKVFETNYPQSDYTLAEIGKVLGITRERTRQIESNVIRMIKRPGLAKILRDYSGEKEPFIHESRKF